MKFGTDGWRGIIADDFTFDNVRICAQAVADYLKNSGLAARGLVIGYDTRFASKDFAEAAAEVICGNNIKVYLCNKATPTPVVSYGVLLKKAGGAVVITASHNPAQWNGFKYKSDDGASAPTEVIAEIEKNIASIITNGKIKRLSQAEADKQGLIEHIDLASPYHKQIRKFINLDELGRGNLKIVVDSMHGAGAGYYKMLLADSSHKIIEINDNRNPSFPDMKQPEPIAVNLSKLSTKIKEEGADIGIATDGDADRLGIMDEKGNFLTQLQVFALLALYLLEVRQQQGALVKTITSTSMLDRLGEIFNMPVYETSVGFKYVAPIMLRENALIGGEESGGYGFRGHVPERDAILAGLFSLDLVSKTGKTPSQLLSYLYSKVGPHHYNRLDIEFAKEQRDKITGRVSSSSPEVLDGVRVARKDTFDGFRFILADTSWLLIRFSGTEPLLRIYAESDSPARVERLLKTGRQLTGV
ncbi:MAG: phosphoglucomutase/phosphomannomutase family protein [Dehalococcoidia bacterium]|nr:MAG: phosphoglucomutase/phosphomannomutase family protein [Dehalococcoidia bacterium]